ncbi:MAG: MFS transporter [Clostridiales bacterium]|nr:MFS transporter [Clostridiales bacterium]
MRLPEYKWRIFFVTGLANISTAIAISSISLALPVMSDEFGVSMSAVSWIPLIYSLLPSCTLLIFGRLADLYGYKRQFMCGFLIFGTASVLLPLLSRGLAGAIMFRGVQAIGYAMMISITQAMCNRSFPPEERGKALGVNSIFVSIGLSLGPSVGGLLLSRFSWRAIFYFNAPFSLIGFIMCVLVLKKDELDPEAPRRMDWLGSVFFAIFIGVLAYAVNFSADWGFASLKFAGCLLVSMAALTLFIWRENRVELPLMNLGLFRNPVFSYANSASICSYIIQQMTNFLVPFYLMNVLLISKSDSGFVMLATPLAMMVFSPLGGRYADRYGSRRPALLGLCVIAVGCASMSFMNAVTPVAVVVAALFFYGVGNGFSVSAINAAIFSGVPREHSGTASGMVATMRNLGQGLGVAFGSAIMALRQSHYMRTLAEGAGAAGAQRVYLTAQRDAYFFGLCIVALALFCMFRIPEKR